MPWFPRDRYLWDFWFAEQGERLHLFYLQASQAQCFYNPDLRHDAATIGHAIQTPWGWQEVQRDEPVLVASDRPGAWDSLSIWTGSILQHPESGEYHLFYTSRDRAAPRSLDAARAAASPTARPRDFEQPQPLAALWYGANLAESRSRVLRQCCLARSLPDG